jgi:hypothetical protein
MELKKKFIFIKVHTTIDPEAPLGNSYTICCKAMRTENGHRQMVTTKISSNNTFTPIICGRKQKHVQFKF